MADEKDAEQDPRQGHKDAYLQSQLNRQALDGVQKELAEFKGIISSRLDYIKNILEKDRERLFHEDGLAMDIKMNKEFRCSFEEDWKDEIQRNVNFRESATFWLKILGVPLFGFFASVTALFIKLSFF